MSQALARTLDAILRKRLASWARALDIPVPASASKSHVIEVLLEADRDALAQLFQALPESELADVRQALGLDVSGMSCADVWTHATKGEDARLGESTARDGERARWQGATVPSQNPHRRAQAASRSSRAYL